METNKEFNAHEWAQGVLEQILKENGESKKDYIFIASPVYLVSPKTSRVLTFRGLTKRERIFVNGELTFLRIYHEGEKNWFTLDNEGIQILGLVSLSEETFKEFNKQIK